MPRNNTSHTSQTEFESRETEKLLHLRSREFTEARTKLKLWMHSLPPNQWFYDTLELFGESYHIASVAMSRYLAVQMDLTEAI